MTVWSEVVKRKTAKNGHFWLFLVKYFYFKGFQHLKILIENTSQWRRLYKKESWWWALFRVPKKAQKESVNHRNDQFFTHSATKNAWNLTKFEMELPILCNYHHVKFYGLQWTASWRKMIQKKVRFKKSPFFHFCTKKHCFKVI